MVALGRRAEPEQAGVGDLKRSKGWRRTRGEAGGKKRPERILAEVQRRDTVEQKGRSMRRVMEGRRVCSGDQRRTKREETEGKCEGRGQEEDRLRRTDGESGAVHKEICRGGRGSC